MLVSRDRMKEDYGAFLFVEFYQDGFHHYLFCYAKSCRKAMVIFKVRDARLYLSVVPSHSFHGEITRDGEHPGHGLSLRFVKVRRCSDLEVCILESVFGILYVLHEREQVGVERPIDCLVKSLECAWLTLADLTDEAVIQLDLFVRSV